MTNKEKIRKAEDEKLIEMLNEHGFCSSEVNCREFESCKQCIKKWLEMAVRI